MYKVVKFLPQNFGGYTLSMILSGMFLGYTQRNFNIFGLMYLIISMIIFFVGMYFYAKDNMEQEEQVTIEVDRE